ncbi:unnamed protein product [Sphagnum troendelagicum]|uniref:FAS1 domain-containing protein n=1 Tax=Sphagnum troendelagicum TaxID=128251 RepID=A0ABP0UGL0_9BRYO
MGHAAVDCVKWESSTVLIRCWLQQLLVFGMMIISFAVMFGAHEAIAQVPAAAPAPAGVVVPPQVVQTIVVYLQAAGLTEAATFLETAVRGNVVSLPSAAQGGATIFAPTNLALETSPPVTNSNQLIAYHVALGRYTVPALTAFPVGKQIPTLILNQHLLVTSNDPNNYMIDAQHVVLVDICSNITSATVSCYQVDGVFNATVWGTATSIVNQPPAGSPSYIAPAPQPAAAAPIPTVIPKSSTPAPAPAAPGAPAPSTKGIPGAGGIVPAAAPSASPPYVAPVGAPTASAPASSSSSSAIPGIPSAAAANDRRPNVVPAASITVSCLLAGGIALLITFCQPVTDLILDQLF